MLQQRQQKETSRRAANHRSGARSGWRYSTAVYACKALFRRFHRQKIALYASDCILTSNSVPIPAAKVCSSLRGMCCGSASKPRRNGKKQVRGRLDEFWGESRGWRENSSKEPSDVTATCGASRARPQEEQLYVVAVATYSCSS